MIIAFDIGNSFIKWKIVNKEGEFKAKGYCKPNKLHDAFSSFENTRFELAIFSNVSGEDIVNQLKQVINAERWHQFCSQKSLLGVTNAYIDPKKLGVDRWLAAVEAYNRADKQAVMVVDAGTAITLDVVDEQGFHQGGFIVPSEHLMQESLLLNTAKIKVEESECSEGYGKNTSCAVRVGLQRVLSAWLSFEINVFKTNYPDGRVFLTGGANVEQNLSCDVLADVVIVADLLLDGLIRAGRNLE